MKRFTHSTHNSKLFITIVIILKFLIGDRGRQASDVRTLQENEWSE
jgi:hypothetical protein